MSLNGPLIDWIESREADDVDGYRIVIRLPEKLRDSAWDFVGDTIDTLAAALGTTKKTGGVGLSTTGGADDVSFSLADGSHGNIYIVCGDEYVL